MFCTKCGQQLPDDAAFCFKCGAQIQGEGSGVSSNADPDLEYEAIELEPQMGNIKVLGNLFGGIVAPDVRRYSCAFVAKASNSWVDYDYDYVEFTKMDFSDTFESPRHENRAAMQEALNRFDQKLRSIGWEPLPRGRFWYSLRYRRLLPQEVADAMEDDRWLTVHSVGKTGIGLHRAPQYEVVPPTEYMLTEGQDVLELYIEMQGHLGPWIYVRTLRGATGWVPGRYLAPRASMKQ